MVEQLRLSLLLPKWLAGCLTYTHNHMDRNTHLHLPAPSLTPGFLPLHCSLAPYRITAVCQAALFLSIHLIVTTLSSASVPLEASNLSHILNVFLTSQSFYSCLLLAFFLSCYSLSVFRYSLICSLFAVLSTLFLHLTVSLHLSPSPISTGHSS